MSFGSRETVYLMMMVDRPDGCISGGDIGDGNLLLRDLERIKFGALACDLSGGGQIVIYRCVPHILVFENGVEVQVEA